MKVDIENTKDMTAEYCVVRNNLQLVVEYLTQLQEKPADITVTNESIRLLVKSLGIISVIYLNNYDLPITITELRLENELLKMIISKKENEVNQLIKLKL